MHRLLILTLSLTAVPTLTSGQMRQQDAHEHGVGTLNLAIEGDRVLIELSGPMASFVGFEHAPESATEQQALTEAENALASPDSLLVFNASARCTAADVAVHLPETFESGEHHFEVEAGYEFQCADTERLSHLDVRLFATFPALEEIEAQVITLTGALVQELEPGSERLRLSD